MIQNPNRNADRDNKIITFPRPYSESTYAYCGHCGTLVGLWDGDKIILDGKFCRECGHALKVATITVSDTNKFAPRTTYSMP